MKIVINNNDNLKDNEINSVVLRSRALMINSNNEILLGYCQNTYQFPGGHLKDEESIEECLKREIKEETGIELKGNYTPFYVIKYYSKNWPEEGINRYTEFNYFVVETDEHYNLDNMNLDEYEIENNFELKYVKLDDLNNELEKTYDLNPKNKLVYPEIKDVINEYLKLKNNNY